MLIAIIMVQWLPFHILTSLKTQFEREPAKEPKLFSNA
jgi:hypothetical protein